MDSDLPAASAISEQFVQNDVTVQLTIWTEMGLVCKIPKPFPQLPTHHLPTPLPIHPLPTHPQKQEIVQGPVTLLPQLTVPRK